MYLKNLDRIFKQPDKRRLRHELRDRQVDDGKIERWVKRSRFDPGPYPVSVPGRFYLAPEGLDELMSYTDRFEIPLRVSATKHRPRLDRWQMIQNPFMVSTSLPAWVMIPWR
jgi:hypothetical protein